MQDRPDPKPPSLMPFFWALMMISGWLLVATVPAQQLDGRGPEVLGWALLGGVVLSTGLSVWIDRRFGPPGLGPLWAPPAWWMVPAALVAASGVVILASELSNVISSLSSDVLPPEGEPITERVARWHLAVLVGVAAPLGLGVVLHGVVQRALTGAYRPRTAFIWSVVLGSLVIPAPPLQAAATLLLPVWLYRHTRALVLSIAALAPYAALAGLSLYGVGFGIAGFDVVDPERVVYQPIWFDLLGAALVALGMAPFVRAFEAPP